jgi:hypothetical protein
MTDFYVETEHPAFLIQQLLPRPVSPSSVASLGDRRREAGAVRQWSRGDAHDVPVRTHRLLHQGAVDAGRFCSFVALILYARG